MVKYVNAQGLEELLASTDKTVFCDFWASWCGPCRMLAPVFEELSDKYEGKAVFAKVNVDDVPSLAEAFGVTSIPAIFVLKNGEVANQAVGFMPKDKVLELLK